MDIIYYHGGCPDGWAAAYIAHLRYPDAQLVPLSYGTVDFDRMLLEVTGKSAIMVDFSLKNRAQMDQLSKAANYFHIYDHHKTAQALLEGAVYATFDMDRSGAGLAWDYLFGKDSVVEPLVEETGHPRPWWVNYAEDQDLWRFKLPRSREINNWLNIQDRTVERWDFITQNEEPANAARLGIAVTQYIEYMVKSALKDLQEGVLVYEGRNYRVGIVNNGHVGTSEVGEAIYNAGYDIAIMWREDDRGVYRFGLRSIVADVGAIASLFEGGGGHKNSAGFELPVEAGRDYIDYILGRVIYTPVGKCCR